MIKTLRDLLKLAQDKNASDLHLACDLPPLVRVDGEIKSLELPVLNADDIQRIIDAELNDDQRQKFRDEWQLCYSLTDDILGHYRIEVYYHRRRVELAVRIGSLRPKSFEELGLPSLVAEMASRPRGMLLITGPTGAGKTTTFNAIINWINQERRVKIITVEDPIEYIHKPKKSYVVQQELHTDVKSYANALRHILRQDPDVIGIGEMRDYETISTALTAAETGHLVVATLHTNDASRTINRILDVFPHEAKTQIRNQLASSLIGIISQQLLPRIDCEGRILACELLLNTEAVSTVIREDKMQNLPNIIITSEKKFKMQLMDKCILDLYHKGIVAYHTAISRVNNIKMFKSALKMMNPMEALDE